MDDVGLAFGREILAVDLQKHVGVHQVVGVKEHDHVVAVLIALQRIEGLLQDDGLARGRVRAFLVAFQNVGAHAPGDLHGPVGTVVGQNIEIIQFPRILHMLQVIDDIRDHRLLVVGGNQHQKAQLRIVVLIIFGIALEAKEADDQLVEQH